MIKLDDIYNSKIIMDWLDSKSRQEKCDAMGILKDILINKYKKSDNEADDVVRAFIGIAESDDVDESIDNFMNVIKGHHVYDVLMSFIYDA